MDFQHGANERAEKTWPRFAPGQGICINSFGGKIVVI
jgi:hypothetical protein